MIFPRDSDTLEVINEIEAYLGLPHKNINDISNFKLHEYINKLTLLSMRTL
jgi:hypothetical protein